MIPSAWIALVCAAFLAVSLWRPRVAIAGVIVGLPSYLLRSSVFGIPTTALEAGVVGTVLGWFLRVVMEAARDRKAWHDRVQRVRGALSPPLILFFVIAALGWIVSTIVSIDVRAASGALKAWFVEPALLGIVVLAETKNMRDAALLERALLLVLVWVSLVGLVQVAVLRSTVEDGRLSSVFAPVANYYAMFAAPLIVCAAGLALLRRHAAFALTSVVIGAAAMFLSLSFGGLLAVALGVATLLVTVLDKKYRARSLAGLAIVAAVLLVSLLPTRQFQEKLNFTTRSSSLVRTQIWRTAIEVGREHPFLGIGPGTFEQAYRETVPKLYFPPLEWLVAKPHNLYLNVWVEVGVLGLIGTLGFFVAFLKRIFSKRTPAVRARVYGAAIIAVLAHGLVDTPVFKNDLAVLTVLLIALGLVAVREQAN